MKSMTGYASVETTASEGSCFIEIKAVNFRYLDINVKMNINNFLWENEIKKCIAKVIKRGNISVWIKLPLEDHLEVELNLDLARKVHHSIEKIVKDLGMSNNIPLSSYPEFHKFLSFRFPQKSAFSWEILLEYVEECLMKFDKSRRLEGDDLKEDFLRHIKILNEYVVKWNISIDESAQNYRDRVQKKLTSLLEKDSLEESRIVREVLSFSEKIDFSEELCRFKSHLDRFSEVMQQRDTAIGKRLDFILQEMFREINTLGSKAAHCDISHQAVEAKCLLEKMREQVQNVE